MSDAIPLPPRPNLERYRKQAKDLLRSRANNVAKLSDAQLFIARAHGFKSWPKFAKHVIALQSAASPDAQFEAAADAIVSGDLKTLTRLLQESPGLIRRRSSREHNSTLLHYVAANGIEDFRQKTPANAVEIATLLLDAGAEPNAESDAYGGRATTLGLVATSIHPLRAGLQLPLMQLLLDRGAVIDDGAVIASVANGCDEAAEFLAVRGAPLDLGAAAALGRIDDVERLLDAGIHGTTALHWAAHGGHLDVVKLLLSRNARFDATNAYGRTPLEQAEWSAVHHPQPDHRAIIDTLRATARQFYEEAVGRCRLIDDPRRLAHTLRHLGDVDREAGSLALAERSYDEAMSIYRREQTPPLELANALRGVALLKEELSSDAEAEQLWEEAHRLYVETNVLPGVVESARRIARLASRRGDPERAAEWLKIASAAEAG